MILIFWLFSFHVCVAENVKVYAVYYCVTLSMVFVICRLAVLLWVVILMLILILVTP